MSKNKDSRRPNRKENQTLGSNIVNKTEKIYNELRGVEEYDKKKSQLSLCQRNSKQEAETTPETAGNPTEPEFVNF
jgi:hypothetical protein